MCSPFVAVSLVCSGTLTGAQVNWEKAAKDFGSASIESMKVMTRYAIKKTEGGGGKAGGSAKPSKAGGKKRKGAEEGDNAETKPKKQRGKKAKGEAPKAEGEHVSSPYLLAQVG